MFIFAAEKRGKYHIFPSFNMKSVQKYTFFKYLPNKRP